MDQPPGKKTVISQSLDPYLHFNNQGQELTIYLLANTYNIGRDRNWANLEPPIPENWSVISSRHARLQKDGEDYRLWDGDGQKASTNGLWHERKRIGMGEEGDLLSNGMQIEIGQDPSNYILVTYINPNREQLSVMPGKRRLALGGIPAFPVILGRETTGENYSFFQLDAPTVSRRHATINRINSGTYLLEDCSTNGTFVNGKRLEKPVTLQEGDKIQIGPFTLIFRRDSLEIGDRGEQIRLDAHRLRRTVRDGRQGERILLNDISVPIEPGQLVALVGGSGTGKSTLLKTLLGIAPLNRGVILLNGDNLRQHFDIYRSQIGYVPQDDIVHPDLTVTEVLSYACQLRLPPETPVNSVVKATLGQVKLDFVKNSLVRELSGGQRKRVSIGVELLADPKLFFLDEPTSGLDPGLDLEMMELLRELADQGRTIVLVTHATSNIEKCDRIAFLGRGGNLCYFGPPLAAMDFFEMPARDLKYFANIYRKLDEGNNPLEVAENVRKWHDKFVPNSQPYQDYVQKALGNAPNSQSLAASAGGSQSHNFSPRKRGISALNQWLVLSQRHARLVWRDRASLILALITAPLIIILLACLNETSLAKLQPLEITQAPAVLKVIFIFTCAAIFGGLLSSVSEIVKEAGIYARERLVNLGILPYLGSKLLIRSGLAIIQTILISLVILLGFKSPQTRLIPWWLGLLGTTFLTILASLCLGLLVSAGVKKETTANNSLSLIILPQIILSGVLFKLEGWSSKLSWLTISRWSVGAYGALVDVNAMVPPATQTPLGAMPQPFEPNPVYAATWSNLYRNWTVLGLQAILYLSITVWLQKNKDKLEKSN
jgi:ABC-type multidrug transport system ATPase subunit/pSer/pThr/pTyr-binding forkhead associated (FHA) protein